MWVDKNEKLERHGKGCIISNVPPPTQHSLFPFAGIVFIGKRVKNIIIRPTHPSIVGGREMDGWLLLFRTWYVLIAIFRYYY